jgi:exonuclease III
LTIIEQEYSSVGNDVTSKNPLSHMGEYAYPRLKSFKIGQLNITSLVKHVEELRIFIHEQPIDILCINEIRLDNSISSAEVEICCYEIVRRDRNRNGGDVASYLRNNIPYVERSDLIPENVEALCLGIRKPKSKPVLLSTWYRPPDSNIELLECFENFLKKTDDENKEITIIDSGLCALNLDSLKVS